MCEFSFGDIESFRSFCLLCERYLIVSVISLLNEFTHQIVPSMALAGGTKASLRPTKVNVWESASTLASETMLTDGTVRNEVDGARKRVSCS